VRFRPLPRAAPSAARRILCPVVSLSSRGSSDALLPLWQVAFADKAICESVYY
jgi:hypothetical protein